MLRGGFLLWTEEEEEEEIRSTTLICHLHVSGLTLTLHMQQLELGLEPMKEQYPRTM